MTASSVDFSIGTDYGYPDGDYKNMLIAGSVGVEMYPLSYDIVISK